MQYIRFDIDGVKGYDGDGVPFLFHTGDEFTCRGPFHGTRGGALFHVAVPGHDLVENPVSVNLHDSEYTLSETGVFASTDDDEDLF